MISEHQCLSPSKIICSQTQNRFHDFISFHGSCFFHCFQPEIEPDVVSLHRIVGYATTITHIRLPVANELIVPRMICTHKIVPRGKMADQRFGIYSSHLLFANRKCHHRQVFGRHSMFRQFIIETDVGIAVNHRNYRCLPPFFCK